MVEAFRLEPRNDAKVLHSTTSRKDCCPDVDRGDSRGHFPEGGVRDKRNRSGRTFPERIAVQGGVRVDRARMLEQKNRQREAAARAFQQAIEKVHEFGCLVKDLDIGLIDFPDAVPGRRSLPLLEAGRTRHPILARRETRDSGAASRLTQDFSNTIGASCPTECARIGELSRGKQNARAS